MKKILPIISVVGLSALIVGCDKLLLAPKSTMETDIIAFQTSVSDYEEQHNDLVTNKLNKYDVTIESDIDPLEDNISKDSQQTNDTNLNTQLPSIDNGNLTEYEEAETPESADNTDDNINENTDIQDENVTPEEISTLYSLSSDIDESCDDFCELKEELTDAIVETQNLIQKVKNKEIELTAEQRLLLNHQSAQLKTLARQLSNVTTELAINISDISELMRSNNQNIDDLSLKYLIVLDNLVNGNEMLANGLNSLHLMNKMLYFNPDNGGRFIYKYQENDNPPVIKDYKIDENGNLIENNTENTDTNANSTIDTYQNTNLKSNIDTYISDTPRNIDSFFNTALLDNDFMYGNGGYAYGMNPYMMNYNQYQRNNRDTANNGVDNNKSIQDIDNTNTIDTNNSKKKFALKKNIDTYKDAETPDLKTKFSNFKNSVNTFFNRFKKPKIDDELKQPIQEFATTKEQTSK